MSDGGVGGDGGVSDAEATAFAESQGAIGLGSLGLTAGQLAGVEASGVAASFSGPSPSPPGEGQGELTSIASVIKPEVAEAKVDQGEAITRKKRRRSFLTEEEGGLAGGVGFSPVQKRSILGR